MTHTAIYRCMSSFNCFIISDQSGYPLQQLLGSGLAPSHEIPKVDWTCFIHHAKYSVHQNSQIACWTFRTVRPWLLDLLLLFMHVQIWAYFAVLSAKSIRTTLILSGFLRHLQLSPQLSQKSGQIRKHCAGEKKSKNIERLYWPDSWAWFVVYTFLVLSTCTSAIVSFNFFFQCESNKNAIYPV